MNRLKHLLQKGPKFNVIEAVVYKMDSNLHDCDYFCNFALRLNL